MSDSMDKVRARANKDLNIAPPVASLIVALANELDYLATVVHDLREAIRLMSERHVNQMVLLRKEVDKLKGIHGA